MLHIEFAAIAVAGVLSGDSRDTIVLLQEGLPAQACLDVLNVLFFAPVAKLAFVGSGETAQQ